MITFIPGEKRSGPVQVQREPGKEEKEEEEARRERPSRRGNERGGREDPSLPLQAEGDRLRYPEAEADAPTGSGYRGGGGGGHAAA